MGLAGNRLRSAADIGTFGVSPVKVFVECVRNIDILYRLRPFFFFCMFLVAVMAVMAVINSCLLSYFRRWS
jgi:hypothetical protein